MSGDCVMNFRNQEIGRSWSSRRPGLRSADKDTLNSRRSLRSFSLDAEDLETTANDSNDWPRLIVKCTDVVFEADCKAVVAERKRRLRKSKHVTRSH